MERDYKSGSLMGYDTFPLADVINAKRIVRHNLIAKIVRDEQVPDSVLRRESRRLPVRQRRHLSVRAAHRPSARATSATSGYDFKKIWFSEEAEESRRFIRDSKCFCTYECFLTINILFNPRMLLSVFKEWAILKLRKAWRKVTGKQPARASLATCGTGASTTATA